MRLFLTLISVLVLSSFAYSKVSTTNATISYLLGDNLYSHHMDSNLTLLDESQNGDALSMIKTTQERYTEDNSTIELEIKISVTINRDIVDLVIADEIAYGFTYQDGSLLLNGIALSSFLLLDSALSFSVGNVKKAEIYELRYIVKSELVLL